MDIQKTAQEIGLFETATNLAKVNNSYEVLQKVGESFPLPSDDIQQRTKDVAQWLLDFGKSKYMFLNPEIAIVEEMATSANRDFEVIVTIPCDMEEETRERLKNNLPKAAKVSILEEPYFPSAFFPKNGMMIVSGYAAGERAMIFPDTYRMIEHYNGFLGKKVFIPYAEISSSTRYNGWIELNQQRMDDKWRSEP